MWDLKKDGGLWNLLLQCLPQSQELRQSVEQAIGLLQEWADRSDPLQFFTCDRLASNYIQQWILLRRFAAQTKLAEENVRRSIKDSDPNRELIVASAGPSADDIEMWLTVQRDLDDQYYKDVELLLRLKGEMRLKAAGVTRKPPVPAQNVKRMGKEG